jgi:hypothetical protein
MLWKIKILVKLIELITGTGKFQKMLNQPKVIFVIFYQTGRAIFAHFSFRGFNLKG